MSKKIVLISFVMFLGMSFYTYGAGPLDTLKNSVNNVLDILKDPLYKDSTKKELQTEKIWDEIRNIFDFDEIAKRSLARHWEKFTPKQQTEFTDIFSKLLKKIYIKRIESHSNEEEVVVLYLGENMAADLRATVKTKIVTDVAETPVDYRMIMKKEGWKIYDFSVEGVSLVRNYRVQFQEILMKESPDTLIKRLEEKVGESEE